MARKFVIIDAHSIIFRSYFAFIKHPLRNARGENTSGVFGFINMIQKIKKNLSSEYMGLVFDAPGETFRDKAYKEYKATRPAAPPDIPFQIEKVKEIAGSMGIPRFEIQGYEADDVLATLAIRLKEHGAVYIATSDKDLLQMVGDNIYVYDPYQDLVYDRDKVFAKFGVSPEQIPAYLAMTGDTIDNVPGVPGVGPKRAVEIIKKYEDFDDALENDARLQPHRERALLSRELIELKTDVPLDLEIEALRIREPDTARLMPVLIDLEFHSHIKQFSRANQTAFSVQEFQDKNTMAGIDVVGITLEHDQLYLSPDPGTVYRATLEQGASILSDEKTTKAGYDLKKIARAAKMTGPLFDLQIISWLLDPNRRSHSFEDICLHNLKVYAEKTPGTEAVMSRQLYPILRGRLAEQEMLGLYNDIEGPLIQVLANMERRGIKLDVLYLQELDVQVDKKLRDSEKKIYAMVGHEFNINSPRQLAQILFEELGLKPAKRGKTHYSTNYEVLAQLSLTHDVPREILTFRELAKMKSTYLEPLIMLSRDGRIHTTFNQASTATGRLSSSNPNIQNIPVRRDLGKEIRKGFIAGEGCTLLSADYSQIELRLLAHFSSDKNLVSAFENGEDIHRHTASVVFGIPEQKVNEKQRRMAKVVNYGLIYGMSDYGLAQRFDIVLEEASQFIESYYTLYPGVAGWREEAVRSAEEKGYAETLFKRRRPLPDLHGRNHALREFSKRAAINTPIQGTAADLIKIAMIDVERELTRAGFGQGLLLSIHDELLFEIENERIREASGIIKDCMENAIHINVPVEVFIGLGRNWAEAH
ncbi:DNA polymerase I [candidate division WOR-3 bacterium]|nr:DNA polymerase I [candidate division WOR-3 bacterium]